MFYNKIQILPDDVINKIAAGEIIERPSAVVKELIENSIDANAKNIKIEISKGGKYSIAVEDDGCGMSKQEALLAIQEHATSKLQTISDLDALSTFGFRGEALPSIASISKFSMTTGQKTSENSHEIILDGGKLISTRKTIKRVGTKISVENLFFNVPARRKFLKSDETETAQIVTLVKNLSVAEQNINFSVFQNGIKVFESPSEGTLSEKINQIFGYQEKFIEFQYSENEIHLTGVICDPNFGNVSKKNITIFINNRLIKNDIITSVLTEELRSYFPNHRGIIAYLLFQIDPSLIDVNVHPMKKEVRFKNEIFIRRFLQNFIANTFNPSVGRPIDSSTDSNAVSSHDNILSPVKKYSEISNLGVSSKKKIDVSASSFMSSPSAMTRIQTKHSPMKPMITESIVLAEQQDFSSDVSAEDVNLDWIFIGKLNSEIAIFNCSRGMIIFNIKLAASRVIHDKIFEHNQVCFSQKLLIPIELTLLPEEAQTFELFFPILEKNGFSVYTFGRYDFKIDAIPEWISYADTTIMLQNLVTDGITVAGENKLNIIKSIFLKKAYNCLNLEQYKSDQDLESLKNELFACKNPLISPIGNVIFFEISTAELNCRFYPKR